MKSLLTEIVRKECERYGLIGFELIGSVEEGVEILSSVWPSSAAPSTSDLPGFTRRREKALNRFYKRLGYKDFIIRNGYSTDFLRFLFFFQRHLLLRMRQAYACPTLDRELAVPPRTLAFKLSRKLDEVDRSRLLLKVRSVSSPHEMEKCCHQLLENRFPLALDTLLAQLEKEDEEYWEEIYFFIREMTVRIASRLYPSIHYKKEIEHDAWSETSLFLYRKTVENLLPLFENALHFRHYILRICANKCHEAGRIHRPKYVLGEDSIPTEGMTDEGGENDLSAGWNTDCWDDIDPDDNAAVSRALTAILWDRTEPWYSRLIEGVEEKVEILLLHYVSGKSYTEIARMQNITLYPERNLSAKQFKRRENNLRQESVRVRKLLKERFIRLLKKNSRT